MLFIIIYEVYIFSKPWNYLYFSITVIIAARMDIAPLLLLSFIGAHFQVLFHFYEPDLSTATKTKLLYTISRRLLLTK